MVMLNFTSKPVSVYCHMGDFGCGDGGWTPVMKIDGNKVYVVLFNIMLAYRTMEEDGVFTHVYYEIFIIHCVISTHMAS